MVAASIIWRNIVASVGVVSAIVSGVCSGALADEGPVVAPGEITEAELGTVREGLVQAFKKRDTAAMLEFVTADVLVTWQNAQVSRGKEELRSFIDRMVSGPNSVVSQVDGSPTIEGRKLRGDHVISVGHMNDSFTLRATGQTLPFDSRFSALLVRENGKLLLSGLHLSINAFDNAILSTAVGVTTKIAIGGCIAALVVGLALGWVVFGRKRAHA